MEVQKASIPHMKAGDDETSYANNSGFQKRVILKARPVLEEAIRNALTSDSNPEAWSCNTMTMADLGCASGSNTFLAVSEMIDIVLGECKKIKRAPPKEFQIFLNDLPGNDFNSVFRSIPAFSDEHKRDAENCSSFLMGVPGSFYQRLFPRNSLSLVHSSSSLHWLSQVPDGLENNNGSIYISSRCPPSVHAAYLKQFEKDFSRFLRLRSCEILPGGRMILQMNGRNVADPAGDLYGCIPLQLVADILVEMATEGLVQEVDVNSFNVPLYFPTKEEVEKLIDEEGSFHLYKLETLQIDPLNQEFRVADYYNPEIAEASARSLRAVLEPLLASHFGEAIIDELFNRFTVPKHLGLGEDASASGQTVKLTVLVISLKKK